MSYIGETPVKKFARLRYWQEVQKLCGHSFLTRPHVFLASEHAGDASVLRAMGVPWENMVAVDLDAKACANASRRWPRLRVEHDAIDKFATRWTGMHPASVYLDFCAELCRPVIDTFCKVTRQWCATRAVGVTLLKGREKGKFKVDPSAEACFKNQGCFRPLGLAIEDLPGLQGDALLPEVWKARTRALQLVIERMVLDFDGRKPGVVNSSIYPFYSAPDLQRTWSYRTTSPMVIALYRQQGSSGAKAAELMSNRLDEGVVNYPHVEIPRASISDVRACVLAQSFGRQTAGLLNVDARQAAAWKAHATRGTYDVEAAE